MCEYPNCQDDNVNAYNMCKKHEVKYSTPSSSKNKPFDLNYIQSGLKRMAYEAKIRSEEDKKVFKMVQETLL